MGQRRAAVRAGWPLPRGGLPQFPGDYLKGPRDRDDHQCCDEAAERAPSQPPIEAPTRTDSSTSNGLTFLVRLLHRRVDDSDPCELEDRAGRGAEAGVPVVRHQPRPDAGVIEIRQEVPGLLPHPGLDRVLRGSENPDPAAAVLDDGQDVHLWCR